MSPSLIIDIETGPLADDRLMELWSSPPLPEAPAEFQPLRIRLKSRGDEKETEERIERARCAHLRKLDQHRRECQRIQDESFHELRTKAALSALTGEVLAIGYGMSGSIRIECQDSQRGVTERDLLISFWQVATKVRHSQGKILGFNSLGFDIPFLIQRSWMHSVDVPRWVRDGRYFDRAFIDLLEVWKCGTYRSKIPQKLDSIVRAMGLGGNHLVTIDSWVDGAHAKKFEPSSKHNRKLIALKNGLFDLQAFLDGKGLDEVFVPHTPHWFSLTVLPYEFDPTAPSPTTFLNALYLALESDQQRIDLLQEWMG